MFDSPLNAAQAASPGDAGKPVDRNRRMNNSQAQRRRNGNQRAGRDDLNHLLSFHLPPRQAAPTPRRSRIRPSDVVHSKDRYVNAQFRFVLKPTGDYTVHFADPDIYFNWPDILQVIVPVSSVLPPSSIAAAQLTPSCPICLSEPTAPRMTKCGHTFCYPCILHYIELAEGTKWRKCPICYDAVYAKDLKSVKYYDPVAVEASTSIQQNGEHAELPNERYITMRLVQRPQFSTIAIPRSKTFPSDAVAPQCAPWQFVPDADNFARFMLADPNTMTEALQQDLEQLQAEEDLLVRWSGKDDIGIVFVKAAMRKVAEQIAKVDTLKPAVVMAARKKVLRCLHAVEESSSHDHIELDLLTTASETEEDLPHAFLESQGLSIPPPAEVINSSPPKPRRRNVNPPAPDEASYYFYQAASGENMYLHPLDIKILKSHFATYSHFPDAIRVRVEGADEGSVSQDLRKRCKYLSHLPTACDITFIEADLSTVVSPEALEPYNQALRQRRNRRREKVKKDDKAKAKYEAQTKAAETRNRSTYIPSSQASHHTLDPGDETLWAPELIPSTSPISPVARDMTRNMSGHPTGPTTVWGTRAVTSSIPPTPPHGPISVTDIDLGNEAAWLNFESDVIDALPTSASPKPNEPGSAKKKSKKVVLSLSGGGRRG